MPFQPRDFYELAVWLTRSRRDESSFRTAIGRAYFASHHLAAQKLTLKRGWVPKGTGDDHGAVIRELNRGTTTRLAQYLQHLRLLREHSDYHLDFSPTSVLRDCNFCEKAQKVSSSGPTITEDNWLDAEGVSKRCLPLIEKL